MINSDREGDQHVKVDVFACRCLLPDLMSQLENPSQETKYLAYNSRCADHIVRVFVTHSRLSTAPAYVCGESSSLQQATACSAAMAQFEDHLTIASATFFIAPATKWNYEIKVELLN